jgi:PAS domain S-box-containing protein
MEGHSPSGFDAIPHLRWGSHLGQFFESGDDLRDLLVPYFKAGLENNESCLWVAGEAFTAEQARSALRTVVSDLDGREKRGQIEIRDAHEWYDAGAKIEPLDVVTGLLRREEKALALGWQGLRTNGNCAWVQNGQWTAFQEYETLVQQAVRGRRMICMCSYCFDRSQGAEMLDVMERHDFIVPRRSREGELRTSVRIGDSDPQSVGAMAGVLEAIPAAVYTTDAEGYLTYYNDAAERLWGYPPEIGKQRWCGAWKFFLPDGTYVPRDQSPMMTAVRTGLPIQEIEADVERPDGTRVPCAVYPSPLFDDAGKVVGGINMLVDITARKRGEAAAQHLAAIVESSEDAILSTNFDSIIATWNKGAERIFGYTASEIIGKSVFVLIPDELHREEPSILSSIRDGARINHYETVRRRKDGTLLDISLTVSPVRGMGGKIVGVSKIARDISDVKRAREQSALLLREMDHRVKNLFALANGVVALSARSAATPKELAHTVGERLGALARAHAITLSNSPHCNESDAAMLHSIIDTIAAPYKGELDNGRPRVVVTGADIQIFGQAVTSFALLLHELMTNSTKYGALSAPEGYVEINIAVVNHKVTLVWLERGGPRIGRQIDYEGFGTELARLTVTGQLGGEIVRDWQPEGLCIRLSIDRSRLESSNLN